MSPKPPIPREHGAWGLLLQPFVAGAILGGQWTNLFVPALGMVLMGFLMREPLTVMAREMWVFRRRGYLAVRAAWWAGVEGAALLGCLLTLARWAPLGALAALAGVGVVLTGAAVAVSLKNRQRSVAFQVVSAAGLGTTGLLAVLVGTGGIPGWAWWLWGLLSGHAMASIPVVHARLRARAGRKSDRVERPWLAYAGQAGQLAAAGAVAMVEWRLAVPLMASALANGIELWRLRTPANLEEALTRVGYRTLAVALLHMVLTITCLWPLARG